VVEALGRFGLPYVGEVPHGEEAPASRLVLALVPSFDPEAVPGLEGTYELDIAGEVFTVAASAGRARVERGRPPDAALRLRTDAATLVRMLRGQISAAEAASAGKLAVESRPDAGALPRGIRLACSPGSTRRLVTPPVGRPADVSAAHLVAEVPEDVPREVDARPDSVLRQLPHGSILLPVAGGF
jgi:hypothetical protein